jgi:ADP-ribose pyrophosphatase YjhB (NUDIX family)
MSTPLHEPTTDGFSHAGGIAYRERNGRREILLVRAKRNPDEWVLPKGHVETGETLSGCARREIREEAGVDAEPLVFIGEDRFTAPSGESVSAAFFLMRFVKDVPADEHRERRWFTFATALSVMRFEGARQIILAAEAHLGGRRENSSVASARSSS